MFENGKQQIQRLTGNRDNVDDRRERSADILQQRNSQHLNSKFTVWSRAYNALNFSWQRAAF